MKTESGKVCERCKGRGIVYLKGAFRATCPECRGRSIGRRAEVLNGLDHCYSRFQKGETSDFNLELAVRRCLDAGLSESELRGRGIPAYRIALAVGGQGQLSLDDPLPPAA